MKKKTIVGYSHQGYPEQRNFLYAKTYLSSLSYKRKLDVFKVISFIVFKLKRPNYKIYGNLHFTPFGSNSETLFHFFNGVSFSNEKWVSTFETFLPRLFSAPLYLKNLAFKNLASKNCLAIIALSNCTKKIQADFLKKNVDGSLYDKILRKCIVLHPPQELLINSVKEKELNLNTLVFTLVGADFFRKGGMEILRVFQRLTDENYRNWHLNVVSSMQYGDYATKTTQEDQALALKMIKKNKNITHHKKLPNQEVIDLFKKSHVGLLPTWADTYGYSVLEAQACGCPVITTDIRALPEINNEECGWVINVPKDDLGNGKLRTEEERSYFSECISEQLHFHLKKILDDPQEIYNKGEASIDRIKDVHHPKTHANQLIQIYKSKR